MGSDAEPRRNTQTTPNGNPPTITTNNGLKISSNDRGVCDPYSAISRQSPGISGNSPACQVHANTIDGTTSAPTTATSAGPTTARRRITNVSTYATATAPAVGLTIAP